LITEEPSSPDCSKTASSSGKSRLDGGGERVVDGCAVEDGLARMGGGILEGGCLEVAVDCFAAKKLEIDCCCFFDAWEEAGLLRIGMLKPRYTTFMQSGQSMWS